MSHMKLKLTIASVVLLAAVAYLATAGMKKGWVYYMDVDSFLADEHAQASRVRLAGRVADENLDIRRADLEASFTLLGPHQRIAVVFRGVVPDTFVAGGDVVIEGKRDEAGLFHADILMTKCASKYQAEEHAKRLEAAP